MNVKECELGYKVANVNYEINGNGEDIYITFDLIDENGVKLKTQDELYYETGIDVFEDVYDTKNPTMEQVVEQVYNAIENDLVEIVIRIGKTNYELNKYF